jgi:hypothetical protein
MQSRSVGRDLLDKVLQECAITSADRLHFSLATQEDNYLVSSICRYDDCQDTMIITALLHISVYCYIFSMIIHCAEMDIAE